MLPRVGCGVVVLLAVRLSAAAAAAEDTRGQYPAFLDRSYFGASLGSMHYGFSSRQLQPGFQAAEVETPHPAARVTLFGRELSRFLSAQVTYMRPVVYVSYRDVNGDGAQHRLLVHFGGLTLRPQVPVGRLTLFGEVGLGITTRRGVFVDDVAAIAPASYASALLGGGADYHLSGPWDLSAGVTWSPGSSRHAQPATLLGSAGFRYNLRRRPPPPGAGDAPATAAFPRSVLQAEYTTGVGYGVNDFVSRKVPIFWGGAVKVARGAAVHFQRNVFHTRKRFGFDLGASASWLESRGEGDRLVALSAYPLFRLTVLRFPAADIHVFYSLAGPSYVSRSVIDGRDTGGAFTFQDFMGVGAFVGRGRRVSAAVKINHYSNGNILTENAGVKVPLTFGLGLTF